MVTSKGTTARSTLDSVHALAGSCAYTVGRAQMGRTMQSEELFRLEAVALVHCSKSLAVAR